MISTVDSNQKKLYTLLQRLLIKLLLSPDSPEQYGTEIGSQLSFSFPQAVSLFSGSGVKPLLSQKTHRRSSMPTADCLRKKEQPSKKSILLNSNSLLQFLDSLSTKSVLPISIIRIKKKETTQKKKEDSGPASSIISKEMRKFFGGAGNPTWQEEKHTLEVSTYA